jgi:hypothetical protein
LARATGNRGRWRSIAVRRLLQAFGEDGPPGDESAIIRCLDGLTVWPAEWPGDTAVGVREFYFPPLPHLPHRWPVPAIPTKSALAGLLGLTPGRLAWFADIQNRAARAMSSRLRHYRFRWVPKRRNRWRLLEIPKDDLKAIQARILRNILNSIPPHAAAHAYRTGRSIATYAGPHVGRAIVIRFDLRDFFPSVPASRVHALFRSVGYSIPVARMLTGLCTHRLPADEWHGRPAELRAVTDSSAWERYRERHLPQGAPTSPALANLCSYRLDARLTALATSLGANYTRYADDLAFSGDERFVRSARRFQITVGRIAAEEGFDLHYRKSRFMRRGLRQQLAGIVVNDRLNVVRAEYDKLKAILTNAARHGPAGENRDGRPDFRAYLLGRIGYVALLNPVRGQKLKRTFDSISWPAAAEV